MNDSVDRKAEALHFNHGHLLEEPDSPRRFMSRSKVVIKSDFTPKVLIDRGSSDNPILYKYVLHPDSVFHVIWEVCSLFLILYQALIIPFTLGFSVELSGSLGVYEFIVTLFFMADISSP